MRKALPWSRKYVCGHHDELPIEDTPLETLEARELIPFKKAFRARLDLVMTAHIRLPP